MVFKEDEEEGEEEQDEEQSFLIKSVQLDHVLVHGMTVRDTGQRGHPSLSRFSGAAIIRRFREGQVIASFFLLKVFDVQLG